MKIGYLINYAGAGGSEKYVKLMAEHAQKQGHGVVFLYNQDGPLREHMEGQGYPTYQLTMNSPFDFEAAKKLADICKAEGIGLIHTQFPRENYVALLAKRRCKGLQLVYTCHLLYPPSMAWTVLNKVFTRGDKQVIAVCHAVKKLLVAGGIAEGKITVIHNAIQPDFSEKKPNNPVRERHGIGPDDFLCVILGRYTPEKGLPFLVDIFAQLKGVAKCLIVGDGPDFEAVKAKIAALSLQDTVIQAGYRTDVADYLEAGNLALNTSNSEALSFAILEGMAKGLPTVATDIGGNGELLRMYKPCGEIVPYGDVPAFAKAITRLKNNIELYNEYSENAQNTVKNYFSLDKMIAQTMKIYEENEKHE